MNKLLCGKEKPWRGNLILEEEETGEETNFLRKRNKAKQRKSKSERDVEGEEGG